MRAETAACGWIGHLRNPSRCRTKREDLTGIATFNLPTGYNECEYPGLDVGAAAVPTNRLIVAGEKIGDWDCHNLPNIGLAPPIV
jgi:hypothetical protein